MCHGRVGRAESTAGSCELRPGATARHGWYSRGTRRCRPVSGTAVSAVLGRFGAPLARGPHYGRLNRMIRPHRKRKVTYDEPGHAHFVTYSCYQRLPLLSKDRSRQWVVETVEKARAKWVEECRQAAEVELWPFFRTSDFEEAKKRPKLLAGRRRE